MLCLGELALALIHPLMLLLGELQLHLHAAQVALLLRELRLQRRALLRLQLLLPTGSLLRELSYP